MSAPNLSTIHNIFRTVRLGGENVRAHKLRSALTVLGIVFGVCSVISMLAIGEGASAEVQEQLRRLGSQNIIVKSIKPPQNPEEQSATSGFILTYGLTYADAERLAETLPEVQVVVPIKVMATDLWYGSRKVTVDLLATVPWMLDNQVNRLLEGRFITAKDLHDCSNVVVLGVDIARKLFRYEDPMNQSVRIGTDVYRVIGLVEHVNAGANPQGVDLASQQSNCFVPLTTVRARIGDTIIRRQQGGVSAEKVELSELILKVDDVQAVAATAQIVEQTMASAHEKQDYQVIVPLRLLQEAERTKRIFSIVLSSIAAISLLVGGIGIMNIMLASVSERTREIGVRRALGARQRDIMAQFLVETLILSIGGGLLGMVLGAVVPLAVTYWTEVRTVLTPFAFILSFAVSAAVGLIFGLYPARRAAMMDPIEALRHE